MKTVLNYIIVAVGTVVGFLAVFAAESLWKICRRKSDMPSKTELILYRIAGGILIIVCCYAVIHYLI